MQPMSSQNLDINFEMGCTNGNNAIAMTVFTPVCTSATCFVIPVGIPSLTNIPAIHIVPVVPTFAPSIAAIADGKGNEPEATSPITAVVVSDEDCHNSVQIIAPKNIQYGFPRNHSSCSMWPMLFIPEENILSPT